MAAQQTAARAVHAGLRPEHLTLGDDAPGWPVLLPEARVDVIETTGADAMVWAVAPIGRVCARVPAAAAPALDASVCVRANPAGLSLFDPSSGVRL